MNHPATTTRPVRLLPGLLALALVTAFAVAVPRGADAAAPASLTANHAHTTGVAPHTAAEVALHDQMRKLWEDHVTWTRLAIAEFADGFAGFGQTAARLLHNQTDLGNAVKPFYGDAAGERLTALLHNHITIAGEILQAAKAGDTAAFADGKARWYANADDIADFFASANPRFWPQATMRGAMKEHLDQTLSEAAHEPGGDYAAGVADYDQVHQHILALADLLSGGIIGQFPAKVNAS
jgi:hypothetical protein